MANKTIFAINTEIPGDVVREISYGSSQTLLDADIILFTPAIDGNWYSYGEYFQGKPRLSQYGSFTAVKCMDHWKNEIIIAANSGKLVVVYLAKPNRCFRDTGQRETSGTGRNEKVTNIVSEISSYDSLPIINSYPEKTGTSIKLTKPGSIIAPYWDEFSDYSSYQVEITGKFSDVVLESVAGNRIIGAIQRSKNGGAILFLPPINFDQDEFVEEDDDGAEVWTKAGLQAGQKFVSTIRSLAQALSADQDSTPPPDWASDDQFRLSEENRIENEIGQVAEELTRLGEAKSVLQNNLAAARGPRRLLFEKGKPLEEAILESLELMGFKAVSFDNGDSEFDAVFTAPEGRFIGEAEGRDNRAIGIQKLDQLERNIHEDFDRDEVDEIAKGVLFGNGYRLTAPEERAETFTEKCLQAAKRTGTALIRTLDMFEPTRYLTDHPEDQDYAEACRKAIAGASGDIVKFPVSPKETIRQNKKKSSKN